MKVTTDAPPLFSRLARWFATLAGKPISFFSAIGLILGWTFLGPIFHYSDTWQLVINTATTIVTFLMVFLIQNSQNRDTQAIQIKLDELIRAISEAHSDLINVEDLSDKDLQKLQERFARLAEQARRSSVARPKQKEPTKV
jgi:low affinity Fe/Cu permease